MAMESKANPFSMDKLDVYVDANPKSVCFVAVHPKLGKTTIVREIREEVTCVQAEYKAIITALQDLAGHLTIYCDNQVVVKQLNHESGIKDDSLRELAMNVWDLIRTRRDTDSASTKILWISRKKNLAGKVLG